MSNGKVINIFLAPNGGAPMESVNEVLAEAGKGLVGDRYHAGTGSFVKKVKNVVGKRQVTLINLSAFPGSNFLPRETRRNILTEGVELMWLIGREFKIGEATFRGVKYCDPCSRPSKLAHKHHDFKDAFHDKGGLIAEVLESGLIRIGDDIVPPPKDY
jgi:MOSC domain-containing protein YiiM